MASQFHRPPRLDVVLSSNPGSHFRILPGKRHATASLFHLPTYTTTKLRAGSSFLRLFARETPETRKLNDRLRERKASRVQARTADKVSQKIVATRRDVT